MVAPAPPREPVDPGTAWVPTGQSRDQLLESLRNPPKSNATGPTPTFHSSWLIPGSPEKTGREATDLPLNSIESNGILKDLRTLATGVIPSHTALRTTGELPNDQIPFVVKQLHLNVVAREAKLDNHVMRFAQHDKSTKERLESLATLPEDKKIAVMRDLRQEAAERNGMGQTAEQIEQQIRAVAGVVPGPESMKRLSEEFQRVHGTSLLDGLQQGVQKGRETEKLKALIDGPNAGFDLTKRVADIRHALTLPGVDGQIALANALGEVGRNVHDQQGEFAALRRAYAVGGSDLLTDIKQIDPSLRITATAIQYGGPRTESILRMGYALHSPDGSFNEIAARDAFRALPETERKDKVPTYGEIHDITYPEDLGNVTNPDSRARLQMLTRGVDVWKDADQLRAADTDSLTKTVRSLKGQPIDYVDQLQKVYATPTETLTSRIETQIPEKVVREELLTTLAPPDAQRLLSAYSGALHDETTITAAYRARTTPEQRTALTSALETLRPGALETILRTELSEQGEIKSRLAISGLSEEQHVAVVTATEKIRSQRAGEDRNSFLREFGATFDEVNRSLGGISDEDRQAHLAVLNRRAEQLWERTANSPAARADLAKRYGIEGTKALRFKDILQQDLAIDGKDLAEPERLALTRECRAVQQDSVLLAEHGIAPGTVSAIETGIAGNDAAGALQALGLDNVRRAALLNAYFERNGRHLVDDVSCLTSVAKVPTEHRLLIEERYGKAALESYDSISRLNVHEGVTFGMISGIAADEDPATTTAGDIAKKIAASPDGGAAQRASLQAALQAALQRNSLDDVAAIYALLNQGRTADEFGTTWLTLLRAPAANTEVNTNP
jgi:hypothetical protein